MTEADFDFNWEFWYNEGFYDGTTGYTHDLGYYETILAFNAAYSMGFSDGKGSAR